MNRIKGIAREIVREDLMSAPAVQAAYEAEERKERLQAMLAEWRNHAGLTRAQVAERMGVTPPAVSRMESNIIKASSRNTGTLCQSLWNKTPTDHVVERIDTQNNL
jgi:DNA-binding XRE family transcriptional regulator